ncbi:MAG TPA: hypothetical protein VFY06_10190 [Verrucomicrobiae bacterium]|nr:hypothetical protein [Verrucomicrobiae bacterium]
MSSSQSIWLAASLFPLKIYTLFVGVMLFFWNEEFSPNKTDFAYIAYFARWGYFLCAVVLVGGGIVQISKVSRKSGVNSLIFGFVALLLGLVLAFFVKRPYLGPPGYDAL